MRLFNVSCAIVFTVLTFAVAKVQQISDICKHLHKKLSFLPVFLVYQHVKDQIIYHLVIYYLVIYHLVMHWVLFLRPEPGLYIVCFLIINGLVGFSIYINIKPGAKLQHFYDTCV